MEVDVQLLVGAATTVFLALLFFGVVVLWDVALALRSVGDKIDKLEDNVDDDLSDIAHALDTISSAPGGNATQLHLSGGTISSGPTAGQPQEQPQQNAQATPTDGEGQDPHQQQHAQHPPQQPQDGPKTATADGEAADGPDATDVATGSTPSEVADTDSTTNVADTEPHRDDELEDDSGTPHPRAEQNRGRFVTSPDRTAWYLTALEDDVVRPTEPLIAGELTDGSETDVDESEIIAAGPVESAESDGAATSEERSNAGNVAVAEGRTATDATSDRAGAADDASTDRAESAGDTDEDGSTLASARATTVTEDETGERDTSDDPTSETDRLSFDEDGANDEGPSDEPSAATTEPAAGAGDAGVEVADTDVSGVTDADEGGSDADDTDSDEMDDKPSAGESEAETAATDLEPVDETDVDVRGATDDSQPDASTVSDSEADQSVNTADGTESDTVDQSVSDDIAAFEFKDEPIEDDVTVEEAVDTINDEAPAPELSSHKFDVAAELHEDGEGDSAVLVFEFDPNTVEISGSTKRLLQYQMRSFADREETPDGDVTIGQQRIVIEIPDSDGNAVQRWGEAAVSIIDRTLYLSDNSSDDS